MFRHTYETTACSSYAMRDTMLAVERAKINGELRSAESSSGNTLYSVLQVTPYSKAVPAFHHPIMLEADGRKIVVVDQRPNLGMDRNGTIRITQKTQYDFLTLRGCMEWLWNNDYVEDMAVAGLLPFKVYCRMMSENIRRRLGLDPMEQQKLVALSGYFYVCQFTDKETLTDDERLKAAVRIRNHMSIPVETSLPLIDGLPVLKNLADFSAAIRSSIHNPRVEAVNPAFLITVNMGQWFGGNAKETVAVAIEYPPAFLSMVFTALNDRGMHSAMFTKLVDAVAKNATATEFRNAIKAFLEATTNV